MFSKIRIIRYIGNKTNLYNFIVPELKKDLKNRENFYDMFAGTCSISFEINKLHKNIFATDISLYSKIIFELLNINIKNLNIKKIKDFLNFIDTTDIDIIIKKYNITKFPVYNELSMGGNVQTIDNNKNMFLNQEYNSRMYFPETVGKKIDIIKHLIKNNEMNFNEEEKIILLNMLLNYADKHANTTGVYGAFLKKNKITKIKNFYNKKLFEEIINYIKQYNNNRYTKNFIKKIY